MRELQKQGHELQRIKDKKHKTETYKISKANVIGHYWDFFFFEMRSVSQETNLLLITNL